MATMEDRFDLLMNPPKMLKVRMIIAALHGVDLDRISETHGEVRAKMRQTLKRNLDWEYELALKVAERTTWMTAWREARLAEEEL